MGRPVRIRKRRNENLNVVMYNLYIIDSCNDRNTLFPFIEHNCYAFERHFYELLEYFSALAGESSDRKLFK